MFSFGFLRELNKRGDGWSPVRIGDQVVRPKVKFRRLYPPFARVFAWPVCAHGKNVPPFMSGGMVPSV